MQDQKDCSKEAGEINIKIGDLVWCPAYGVGIIYKHKAQYCYFIFWSGKSDNDGVSYVTPRDARWFRELLIKIL